jgi:hypothetical protein
MRVPVSLPPQQHLLMSTLLVTDFVVCCGGIFITKSSKVVGIVPKFCSHN